MIFYNLLVISSVKIMRKATVCSLATTKMTTDMKFRTCFGWSSTARSAEFFADFNLNGCICEMIEEQQQTEGLLLVLLE